MPRITSETPFFPFWNQRLPVPLILSTYIFPFFSGPASLVRRFAAELTDSVWYRLRALSALVTRPSSRPPDQASKPVALSSPSGVLTPVIKGAISAGSGRSQ